MHTDAKQLRLRVMFSELRRLKQEELPRTLPDPIEQARYDLAVAVEIERVERMIEEEMENG